MKKLMKKRKASKNNFEAFACVCPTSCTCNTTARRNSNYVELTRYSSTYIVLG